MAKYILVSKLDAARRQLTMAIKLFFNSQDVVVIHVLVANAHDLLRGLCKSQGVRAFIGDLDLELVKPEKRKEFLNMMRKDQNYFKHHNFRTDEVLKFHYGATDFVIWDACRLYSELTNEQVPEFALFTAWFFYQNPDLFKLSTEQKLQRGGIGDAPHIVANLAIRTARE